VEQLVNANPDLDQVWFILSEIHERGRQLLKSLEAAKKNLAVLRKFGDLADNITMSEERIVRRQAAIRR
jgi:hypothetical protein